MKKIILFFLSVVFIATSFIACGGGEGDDPTPQPVVNKEPTVPTLSSPANNQLCLDNMVVFNWNPSTDPNGDAISYNIEIAKTINFSQIEHTFVISNLTKTISLDNNTQYYWRVKATDSKGLASNWSPSYQFQTAGVGTTNYAPFVATVVAPAVNAIVQTASVTLTWNASDPDVSDVLVYDVYFGTDVNPVTKIASNQSGKTLLVNLQPSNTYYWKVVVKDGKGAESQSPNWTFKTD